MLGLEKGLDISDDMMEGFIMILGLRLKKKNKKRKKKMSAGRQGWSRTYFSALEPSSRGWQSPTRRYRTRFQAPRLDSGLTHDQSLPDATFGAENDEAMRNLGAKKLQHLPSLACLHTHIHPRGVQ